MYSMQHMLAIFYTGLTDLLKAEELPKYAGREKFKNPLGHHINVPTLLKARAERYDFVVYPTHGIDFYCSQGFAYILFLKSRLLSDRGNELFKRGAS